VAVTHGGVRRVSHVLANLLNENERFNSLRHRRAEKLPKEEEIAANLADTLQDIAEQETYDRHHTRWSRRFVPRTEYADGPDPKGIAYFCRPSIRKAGISSMEEPAKKKGPLSIEALSQRLDQHLTVPVIVCTTTGSQHHENVLSSANAMIDSGATGWFIDKGFADRLPVIPRECAVKRQLEVIDGRPIESGLITHELDLAIRIGPHEEIATFLITKLGHYPMVLGKPWLGTHNPEIDWKHGEVKFTSTYCAEHCLPTNIHVEGFRTTGEIPEVAYHTKDGPLVAMINAAQWKEELEEDAPVWALYVNATTDNLTSEEEAKLVPERYHDFLDRFQKKAATALPPHRPGIDCKIDLLPGTSPPHAKIYPLSESELKELRNWLDENLAKGFVRPSTSPAGAPILFTKRKTGLLRLCHDYRALNAVTIKDRYPIPLTNEIIDRLKGAKYFTTFDLRNGFNNIRIAPGDEWKTAFKTRYGSFEALVMPFGLTNAPATFQRFVNSIFHDMTDTQLIVYLDDIAIFAETLEELRRRTKEVLKRLRDNHLFLNPSKCHWEKTEIEYLGLIVGGGEVHMDPKKTDAIASWPAPKTVKELQAFLGFANFYRRFIHKYSEIARPLFNLLTKSKEWSWDEDQQGAFQELKSAFKEEVVTLLPDPEKPYFLETDSSDYAQGGVLSQTNDEGSLKPIAFFSKTMLPAERNYDIHDKELLAIVKCFKEWRQYLEGSKHQVTVYSDHRALKTFMTNKTLNRRQARWSTFLAEFDFQIEFRPGKQNSKPDLLSRRPDLKPETEPEKEGSLLKAHHFASAAKLVASDQEIILQLRETWSKIIPFTREDDAAYADAVWNNGVLTKNGLLLVPNDESRRAILELRHDSLIAGHPGRARTLELVSRDYWWPQMTKYVNRYVDGCDTCQRTKPRLHKPAGLLNPLEVPEGEWTDIAYDFIVKLPPSRGFDSILTVVDRFTKRAHFIPCNESINAEGTADLFLQHVWKLHGTPLHTVSDRGTQFNNRFLHRLYERLGISPALSSAYHPQTDGQAERANQGVEQYLRLFSGFRQDDWVDLLPMAEFSWNNSVNTTTGMTPFFADHKYHPTMTNYPSSIVHVPAADEYADRLHDVRQEIESMIKLSQGKQKSAADQSRSDAPEYKTGDRVWLSRRNIKTSRPSDKLDYRHLGPYAIKKVISPVAMELDLPPSMKIHPVFHTSLLSPHRADTIPGRSQSPPPPVVTEEGEEEYEVDEILWSRIQKRGRGRFLQYLVKYLGRPGEDEWRDAPDVANAPEKIQEFYHKHPGAPSEQDVARYRPSTRGAGGVM
jgi:transposase InsO family protein